MGRRGTHVLHGVNQPAAARGEVSSPHHCSHLQPHRAASRPTSARSCGLYSSSSAIVVGTVGCFIRLLSCAERGAAQRVGYRRVRVRVRVTSQGWG